MAFVAPLDGVLNIWVGSLKGDDPRPVTGDRHRGIKTYRWAMDGKHIIWVQDTDGQRNVHVFAVNLTSGQTRDLTPFDHVQAQILSLSQEHPETVLLAVNQRDPQAYDVFRANLESGVLSLVAKNERGFSNWWADHTQQIRAAMKFGADGGHTLFTRASPESPWKELTHWGPADSLTSGMISFAPDNRSVYVISSAGSNAGELREIHPDGTETNLAGEEHADVSDLEIHPTTHRAQAVAFTRARKQWKVLDPSVQADFHKLRWSRRGDFSIINRDLADRQWLVVYNTDVEPIRYFVYNRDERALTHLFSHRSDLEDVPLAKMEPIRFTARDGMTIHGYLSTPPGIRPRKIPMVLLVHTGPWSRDAWEFNASVQWLANRGYAVLQVNHRGSRGYGKNFTNASNREWGRRMQFDLIDGVRWAVDKGIADPDRVAAFGKGYGGYAVLMGLATTPRVFRCGVCISGFADLVGLLENLPVYLKPFEPLLSDRIGHPQRDAEMLRERSPLTHVQSVEHPILVVEGGQDPYLRRSQVQRFVNALRDAGREVEYIEYSDEGESVALPKNLLDFYGRAERFLSKHLGGRFEPP